MYVMSHKKDKSGDKKKEQNHNVLYANIDALERGNIRLQQCLNGCQNEILRLRQVLENREAYIHRINNDYRKLEEKLQREQGKKNAMEKSLNKAMQGLAHNSKEEIIETLKEDVKRLQDELNDRQRKIADLKADLNQLQTKLSKVAGDKMLDGNPGITDLSDPYRPQKLVEMFSILYDNKWTDAYEKSDDIGGDKQICVFLLELFKTSWNFCKETLEKQSKELEQVLLLSSRQKKDGLSVLPPNTSKLITEIRKVSANEVIPSLFEKLKSLKPSLKEDLQPFIESCLEICWYSVIHHPPLQYVFEADEQPDDFRKYTQGGTIVDFVVWPSMYLYANGPILNKGVAQFKV
ncbi:uncharacterized protein [Mytilus edulis]|uniref:uncharacterized protein n=1 Tax=Mytilus edulis TaxID=6550 RepID=UPI0039EE297D